MPAPPTLAIFVPPDAGADETALADGLMDAFGFVRVTNVAPTLLSGGRVLLVGWRDYYDNALGRYPGRVHVLWPCGWAATEARGQGARLRHLLSHLRASEVGVFWSEIGDVPPDGAVRLPPVWRDGPTAPASAVETDRCVLSADASLAVIAGVVAAGAVPCIPRSALAPNARDVVAVAKADAIRAMLTEVPHVLYDAAQPAADLHVCLDSLDAWPAGTIDAIMRGTPVVCSDSVTWASVLPDEIASACMVGPAKSSAMVAEVVRALLGDAELREQVLAAQRKAVAELRNTHVAWAARELHAAGFDLGDRAAPQAAPVPALMLYADTPGWAQDHFVRSLAREAHSWGLRAEVTNAPAFSLRRGDSFYTPVARVADTAIESAPTGSGIHASGGVWSHVSYGGWFTDDDLDPAQLPKSRTHATNLYLHALTGLPYLAAGVDTEIFAPPSGDQDRRRRHGRDRRLVVGFTASLQYNAAVKLFHDLWVPAVRKAGSDGPIFEARVCARPLPVWDVMDARDPKEVAEYLKGVDVYLCTSVSEGCSLSVLEAASAGCAIVSTPCGNAPELACDVVGWDAEEIARAIVRLDRDRDLLYEAQEESRERVLRWWAWTADIKRESWKAWLAGADVPTWREQVPYCARGGFTPADYLAKSRALRLAARPALVRGNMMGS